MANRSEPGKRKVRKDRKLTGGNIQQLVDARPTAEEGKKSIALDSLRVPRAITTALQREIGRENQLSLRSH